MGYIKFGTLKHCKVCFSNHDKFVAKVGIGIPPDRRGEDQGLESTPTRI